MIASSSFGSGFGALGTYLVADADRVWWAETRNMSEGMDLGDGPTPPDPRVVAAEMGDRATRSRAAEPMYHVVVAFDPDDQPTEGEVREAADRTLRDLGLEHHQALLVRHTDRPHAHVHLMVNRVGEDGRAWSPWRQRTRLRASMEAQERELGVRWTGRNRDLGRDANAPPDRSPASPARAFAAEVRAKALGDLREAGSWGELDARLASHGLQVERRGQGGVVTDGTREATLSSVSRTVSRPRLEARLGPLRGRPGDRTPTAGLAVGAPTPPTSARAGAASRDGAPGTTTLRKRGRPRLSTPPRSSASMRARRSVLDGRPSSMRPAAARPGGRSGPVLRGSRFARCGLAALRDDSDVDVERRLTRAAGRAASLAARTLARRATHRDLRPGGRVDRLAALVAERGRVVRLGEAQDHARSVGTNVTARVEHGRPRGDRPGRAGSDGVRGRARTGVPRSPGGGGSVRSARGPRGAEHRREGDGRAARAVWGPPEERKNLRSRSVPLPRRGCRGGPCRGGLRGGRPGTAGSPGSSGPPPGGEGAPLSRRSRGAVGTDGARARRRQRGGVRPGRPPRDRRADRAGRPSGRTGPQRWDGTDRGGESGGPQHPARDAGSGGAGSGGAGRDGRRPDRHADRQVGGAESRQGVRASSRRGRRSDCGPALLLMGLSGSRATCRPIPRPGRALAATSGGRLWLSPSPLVSKIPRVVQSPARAGRVSLDQACAAAVRARDRRTREDPSRRADVSASSEVYATAPVLVEGVVAQRLGCWQVRVAAGQCA